MGVVYLARDVQLDRDVAIKVLPTHLARTAAARERFVREARTAAGLSHPHIVPIHRVGEARGFVFFVMSYVEGETLGERLRTRGPLPPADATRVLREVAWALAYAHGRGIVHRDVKPDNILLEAGTGRALVTDFGIAHGGEDPGPATDPGKIMGTAHYMSPEQAANEPVDGRSDIYSLGVVGYLAVSGRLPFESSNLPALLVRQATEAPPSVMRAAPGLPPRSARRSTGASHAIPPADSPTARRWQQRSSPRRRRVPRCRQRCAPGSAHGTRSSSPTWGGPECSATLTLVNLVVWLAGKRPNGPADIVFLAAIASLPLLPIVGFHLNQARRQFRAGHTLADLRSALEIARRERAETEALAREDEEGLSHRLLRLGTVASATWLAVTFRAAPPGRDPRERDRPRVLIVPVLSTMLLGAVSNALDVQFIPEIRNWWQTGIRERLWNSRAGEWLARRLGAPGALARSRAASAFRATEAALGVAASELFAALPKAYREQLAELPAIVAALEARAAEARAEVDVVAALAPSGSGDAEVLAARREAAAAHLAESVAALEGIRLDLLRLHAGAADLAPLTTLMDAARLIGEDVSRLAEAQRRRLPTRQRAGEDQMRAHPRNPEYTSGMDRVVFQSRCRRTSRTTPASSSSD